MRAGAHLPCQLSVSLVIRSEEIHYHSLLSRKQEQTRASGVTFGVPALPRPSRCFESQGIIRSDSMCFLINPVMVGPRFSPGRVRNLLNEVRLYIAVIERKIINLDFEYRWIEPLQCLCQCRFQCHNRIMAEACPIPRQLWNIVLK